jgi:hypothetical protein
MGQPHLNSDQVLTYMSIRDVIRDWVGRGELFLLSPALDSDPFVRCLYLSRDIYNAITDLGEGVDERMGRLRARLEVFIKGEVVTVSIDPYRSRSAYMSRLDPHQREVWEGPRPFEAIPSRIWIVRREGYVCSANMAVALNPWPAREARTQRVAPNVANRSSSMRGSLATKILLI